MKNLKPKVWSQNERIANKTVSASQSRTRVIRLVPRGGAEKKRKAAAACKKQKKYTGLKMKLEKQVLIKGLKKILLSFFLQSALFFAPVFAAEVSNYQEFRNEMLNGNEPGYAFFKNDISLGDSLLGNDFSGIQKTAVTIDGDGHALDFNGYAGLKFHSQNVLNDKQINIKNLKITDTQSGVQPDSHLKIEYNGAKVDFNNVTVENIKINNPGFAPVYLSLNNSQVNFSGENMIIRNNRGVSKGSLVLEGENNKLSSEAENNLIVSGNSLSGEYSSGAGIYFNGSAEADFAGTVEFLNNDAQKQGRGGGIYAGQGVNLKFNGIAAFENNKANDGGALCVLGVQDKSLPSVVFNNKVAFKNNQARQNGGAVFMRQRCRLDINGGAEFTGNTADSRGGAVYMQGEDYTQKAVLTINQTADEATVFANNKAAGGISESIYLAGNAELKFNIDADKEIYLKDGLGSEGSNNKIIKTGDGIFYLQAFMDAKQTHLSIEKGKFQVGKGGKLTAGDLSIEDGGELDMSGDGEHKTDEIECENFVWKGVLSMDILPQTSGALKSDTIAAGRNISVAKTAKLKLFLGAGNYENEKYTIISSKQGNWNHPPIDNLLSPDINGVVDISGLSFTIYNMSSGMVLEITGKSKSNLSALKGLSYNQKSIASAFDAVSAGKPSPGQSDVINEAANPNLEKSKKVLGEFAGYFLANVIRAQAVSNDRHNLYSRIEERPAKENAGHDKIWVKLTGGRQKYFCDENSLGEFKDNVSGFNFGWDGYEKEKGLVYGLFGKFNKHGISQEKNSADINSFGLGAYGGWFRDALEVKTSLSASAQRYETSRHIPYKKYTAKGGFGGNAVNFDGQIAYKIPLNEQITFKPYAGLEAGYVNNDEFKESGAAGMEEYNLKVKNAGYAMGVWRTGAGVSGQAGNAGKLGWSADFELGYMFAGNAAEIDSYVLNSKTKAAVRGAETGAAMASFNFGADYKINEKFKIFSGLRYALADSFRDYYASMGVNYAFSDAARRQKDAEVEAAVNNVGRIKAAAQRGGSLSSGQEEDDYREELSAMTDEQFKAVQKAAAEIRKEAEKEFRLRQKEEAAAKKAEEKERRARLKREARIASEAEKRRAETGQGLSKEMAIALSGPSKQMLKRQQQLERQKQRELKRYGKELEDEKEKIAQQDAERRNLAKERREELEALISASYDRIQLAETEMSIAAYEIQSAKDMQTRKLMEGIYHSKKTEIDTEKSNIAKVRKKIYELEKQEDKALRSYEKEAKLIVDKRKKNWKNFDYDEEWISGTSDLAVALGSGGLEDGAGADAKEEDILSGRQAYTHEMLYEEEMRKEKEKIASGDAARRVEAQKKKRELEASLKNEREKLQKARLAAEKASFEIEMAQGEEAVKEAERISHRKNAELVSCQRMMSRAQKALYDFDKQQESILKAQEEKAAAAVEMRLRILREESSAKRMRKQDELKTGKERNLREETAAREIAEGQAKAEQLAGEHAQAFEKARIAQEERARKEALLAARKEARALAAAKAEEEARLKADEADRRKAALRERKEKEEAEKKLRLEAQEKALKQAREAMARKKAEEDKLKAELSAGQKEEQSRQAQIAAELKARKDAETARLEAARKAAAEKAKAELAARKHAQALEEAKATEERKIKEREQKLALMELKAKQKAERQAINEAEKMQRRQEKETAASRRAEERAERERIKEEAARQKEMDARVKAEKLAAEKLREAETAREAARQKEKLEAEKRRILAENKAAQEKARAEQIAKKQAEALAAAKLAQEQRLKAEAERRVARDLKEKREAELAAKKAAEIAQQEKIKARQMEKQRREILQKAEAAERKRKEAETARLKFIEKQRLEGEKLKAELLARQKAEAAAIAKLEDARVKREERDRRIMAQREAESAAKREAERKQREKEKAALEAKKAAYIERAEKLKKEAEEAAGKRKKAAEELLARQLALRQEEENERAKIAAREKAEKEALRQRLLEEKKAEREKAQAELAAKKKAEAEQKAMEQAREKERREAERQARKELKAELAAQEAERKEQKRLREAEEKAEQLARKREQAREKAIAAQEMKKKNEEEKRLAAELKAKQAAELAAQREAERLHKEKEKARELAQKRAQALEKAEIEREERLKEEERRKAVLEERRKHLEEMRKERALREAEIAVRKAAEEANRKEAERIAAAERAELEAKKRAELREQREAEAREKAEQLAQKRAQALERIRIAEENRKKEEEQRRAAKELKAKQYAEKAAEREAERIRKEREKAAVAAKQQELEREKAAKEAEELVKKEEERRMSRKLQARRDAELAAQREKEREALLARQRAQEAEKAEAYKEERIRKAEEKLFAKKIKAEEAAKRAALKEAEKRERAELAAKKAMQKAEKARIEKEMAAARKAAEEEAKAQEMKRQEQLREQARIAAERRVREEAQKRMAAAEKARAEAEKRQAQAMEKARKEAELKMLREAERIERDKARKEAEAAQKSAEEQKRLEEMLENERKAQIEREEKIRAGEEAAMLARQQREKESQARLAAAKARKRAAEAAKAVEIARQREEALERAGKEREQREKELRAKHQKDFYARKEDEEARKKKIKEDQKRIKEQYRRKEALEKEKAQEALKREHSKQYPVDPDDLVFEGIDTAKEKEAARRKQEAQAKAEAQERKLRQEAEAELARREMERQEAEDVQAAEKPSGSVKAKVSGNVKKTVKVTDLRFMENSSFLASGSRVYFNEIASEIKKLNPKNIKITAYARKAGKVSDTDYDYLSSDRTEVIAGIFEMNGISMDIIEQDARILPSDGSGSSDEFSGRYIKIEVR